MESKGRILVVDDEVNARTALVELLRDEGYTVDAAADGFKALGKMAELEPDLVLTDLKMPGMDGIQLLGRVREQEPDLPVIVMTAFGDVESAVGAMRTGARDYLSKPVNMGELSVVIAREMEQRRLRVEAGHLRRRLSEKYAFDNIIGSSAPMQEAFKTVVQVAASRASVLDHRRDRDRQGADRARRSTSAARAPRVRSSSCTARPWPNRCSRASCSGTSAARSPARSARRDGRFEQADGGTLFLDEIGEISPRRPGQAAALPAGARVRAGGRQRDDHGRRAGDRGDQPRPARRWSPRASSARTSSTA